jgi:hypothetical protein
VQQEKKKYQPVKCNLGLKLKFKISKFTAWQNWLAQVITSFTADSTTELGNTVPLRVTQIIIAGQCQTNL